MLRLSLGQMIPLYCISSGIPVVGGCLGKWQVSVEWKKSMLCFMWSLCTNP